MWMVTFATAMMTKHRREVLGLGSKAAICISAIPPSAKSYEMKFYSRTAIFGQSVRGIQSSNTYPMVYHGRSAALKSSRLYGILRCQAHCLLRTAMAQPNGMHSGTQRERRSCCDWGWIYGSQLAIMGILLFLCFLSSESWIRHPCVSFHH